MDVDVRYSKVKTNINDDVYESNLKIISSVKRHG